jgi:hypothetical protein
MRLKKKITENFKKEKVKKKKPKKEERKLSSNSETDSMEKALTAIKAEN